MPKQPSPRPDGPPFKALLFADNTVPVSLPDVCARLNPVCRRIVFAPGVSPLHISALAISSPASYRSLPDGLRREARSADLSFLFTNVPYANNFFYDYDGRMVFVSFSGWNQLTSLPITNGIGYFIASVLCEIFDFGRPHEKTTGCVNDFLMDKTGVDMGMRAAFLCPACRASARAGDPRLADVERILDLVSNASRANRSIMDVRPPSAEAGRPGFDVFLCHNHLDKPAIRRINRAFRRARVRTWFDEEQVPPGRPWQPVLEKAIKDVRAACVFVGGNGIGPWQDMEVRGFLSEFAGRGCPVIPVILPPTSSIPELPLFLSQMTWVDLRRNYNSGLQRLIGAVKP